MSEELREDMDVALVAFIGAGVSIWASGLGYGPPEGSDRSGVEIVRRMAAHGPRANVGNLIEGMVREIWQEWRNSRRTPAIVAGHLVALSEIVRAHRPAPRLMTSCVSDAGRLLRQGGSVELVAHRLTSEIILGARTAGALTAGGLDETLCFFLVARLNSALLARHDAIQSLLPAITWAMGCEAEPPAEAAAAPQSAEPAAVEQRGDIGSSQAIEPASQQAVAAVLAPVIEQTAEAFGIPPRLLAAVASPGRSGGDGLDGATDLDEFAARCAEFLAILKTGTDNAPDASSMQGLVELLTAGDLAGGDILLADAENSSLAPVEPEWCAKASEKAPPPVVWRQLRGRLAEISGDWRTAARHYSYAACNLLSENRHERGPLLMRQAAALVALGIECNDEKVLIEAAQVYSEAGGILSEEQSPLEWAQLNVDLGELLLQLGDREARPEQFLAAALHFKPAVDVYSRHGVMDQWVAAQLGLARALKRTGEFQGDVVTLGDAAFAFRAALGLLTRDRSPQSWTDAQLGLGQTLLRIADETGDVELLAEAVPALKAALAQWPQVPSFDVATARAALGRAYAGIAAHDDDETMLKEAISLLESALDAGRHALAPAEVATIEQVRATALWSLGEQRASRRLLEDAVRAKLNALEYYEGRDDALAVSRLHEDLDDLAQAIAALEGHAVRPDVRPALDHVV